MINPTPKTPLAKRKISNLVKAVTSLIIVATVIAACGSTSSKPHSDTSVKANIAVQEGLVYAPLELMRTLDLTKSVDRSLNIAYTTLTSGSSVTEGLIAGQINCGSEAIAPYLVGWSKHIPVKMAIAESYQPYVLNTNDPTIRSIKDFKPGDRIAVPSPESVQATLLRYASLKTFGNANILNTDMVSTPNADAASALISKTGSLVAHFANEPFIQKEEAVPGIHAVLNSYQIMGGPTVAIVLACNTNFVKQHPRAYAAIVEGVTKAEVILTHNPHMAANTLATTYGIPAKTLLGYLEYPGNIWKPAITGIEKWAHVMVQVGEISSVPSSCREVVFSNEYNSCS